VDWLFVRAHVENDFAHFKKLRNVDDAYKLGMCMSLATSFSADAQVPMDPDFPEEIALADSLEATASLLVVNDRVRELFEANGVQNVEWLPVKVINHKRRPVKEKYYVINVLSSGDCIDIKNSVFEWNKIDQDMMSSIKKLVVDETRLPADVKLFRPWHMPYAMMIHRTVADAIMANGLTGFLFTEIAEYQR
jgi:hypothetical protein